MIEGPNVAQRIWSRARKGSSWTKFSETPGGHRSDRALNGVSCSAARACTAAGVSITASPQQDTPLAERWNGTSWRIQATPNPGNSVLAGLSCPSQSACTAAGYANAASGVLTVAEAWDGTTWTVQATPNPATFAQLNGVSCSAPSACTAVGGYANRGAVGLTLAEATS